ncbi:MAG TPA: SemiSWEET transporter [Chryseolinea sp.]|nr:SemiSWEET transporter [Chryseolinea sp.]
MELSTIVGITASVLTGASLLPQLIKIIREKKEQDISFVMLLILLGGVGLWIWYGLLHEDWIIIISNSASALLNLSIFACSFYYSRR